ncbi:MAG: 3-phosphoshikimate 1-carboxyvinyltransferase [Cellulosilyticaceae bacterium]
MHIHPMTSLHGTLNIPGDKSISHRSIMFGSLAKGTTKITNFLMGADCLSTIACFRALGIPITVEEGTVTVEGKGLRGLTAPDAILDCGNSGTTIRLISGILSGQDFETTLTGDASLVQRPMNRVIMPLSQMGAHIAGNEAGKCPLHIQPAKLHGISYTSPVASAQVKSALLLAGLYADGPTTVSEPHLSRDHTERMLAAFGARIETSDGSATIYPAEELFGQEVEVPGDISSAAFFMVAGLITPDTHLVLKNVGINPSRRGILDVLQDMGGDIVCSNERLVCGEPVCDMTVRTSKLRGITIGGATIPTLIDEIPILAVAACFAEGDTVIKDAAELKVKETNRIDAVYNELSKMGAQITPTDDGMLIKGNTPLHGCDHLVSYHDHRMAMSLAIAGINASTPSFIQNSDCVDVSFPGFFETLCKLG